MAPEDNNISNNAQDQKIIVQIFNSENNIPETKIIVNNNISFLGLFCQLSKKSLGMAFSFTFTGSLTTISFFFYKLNNENYLKSLSLILTILNFCVTVSESACFSESIVVSNKLGEIKCLESKSTVSVERQNIIESISTVLINSLIICSPFMLLSMGIMINSKVILTDWFNVEQEIAEIVQSYLRPSSAWIPIIVIRMSIEQILFCYGKQVVAMVTALVTFGLGATVAGVLSLGSTQMGVSGIAGGFILENYLTAFGFGIYLYKATIFKEYHFFKIFKWQNNCNQIKELARIGIPTVVTLVSELFSSVVISAMATNLGSDEAIVQGFYSQLISIPIIISIACGLATCQRFSIAVGEKKYLHAKLIAIYGVLTSLTLVTPFCIIVMADPTIFFQLFNMRVNNSIKNSIQKIVPMATANIWLEAASYNKFQVLKSSRNNYQSSMISIVTIWLGVLIAYLLKDSFGIVGVAGGNLIGFFLRFMCLLILWAKEIQPNSLQSKHQSINQLDSHDGISELQEEKKSTYGSTGDFFRKIFRRNKPTNIQTLTSQSNKDIHLSTSSYTIS